MKPPVWTVPVSIALLMVLALSGVPLRVEDPAAGAAGTVRAAPTRFPRVVVLGIDGLDPEILAETLAAHPERMRHFAALARENGIHPLRTTTPPQSPVAWSTFITGRDPGGHGIFDFLHRDPMGRDPVPSTAVSEPAGAIELFGDWQLPTGGATRSNRSGKAFWTYLAEHGVPADIWRMPANFPVEPALGVSFSGMMTPAIDSAYGECTFYSTDPARASSRVVAVREFEGRIQTRLSGPPNPFKKDGAPATVPLTFLIDREAGAAAVDVDGKVVVLRPGEWSEFVRVRFDLLPLSAYGVGGIVRFHLRSLVPELELYASPVNIDPSDPVTPISAPESASAEVADRARGGVGPFYTQGMPEDVNALKREVLTVPEFMAQAGLVQSEGERLLDHALGRYLAKQDGGLLFFYFSGVDLCGHMMWRLSDETHPHHDPDLAAGDSSAWSGRDGSTWKDTIADLYMQMDVVLGRLRERLPADVTLIVMSDHGFASYARKFNLNRWLWEQGYLALREGFDPNEGDVAIGVAADWSRTRAYGVGFNGLYLNLAGREQDDPSTPEDEGGIVRPGEEARALALELKAGLEAILDPKDGARVVLRADLAAEVYASERLAEAPDLVVGYAAGYGNSDEASLGKVGRHVLEDNDKGGTFNGSHLMAPEEVAGTLMSNRAVLPGSHGLEDLTVEILHRYGIRRPAGMSGAPVLTPEQR